MICHEKWKYDRMSLKATLVGFKIVCPMCNNVIHFGRTLARLSDEYPDMVEEVVSHVAKVNEVSRDRANEILGDAFWKWFELADEDWKIGIDSKLVARFPQLEGLEL